jgi:hypothetical protein
MKGWEGVGIYQADWAHVVSRRARERDELGPKRVWMLRKERREAIDLKAVP